MYDKALVSDKISTIHDSTIKRLKHEWYAGTHPEYSWKEYISIAQGTFRAEF